MKHHLTETHQYDFEIQNIVLSSQSIFKLKVLIPKTDLKVSAYQEILTSRMTYVVLVLIAEPNNDSPLNVQAAELWENQAAYKKVLSERYQRDVTSKEQL